MAADGESVVGHVLVVVVVGVAMACCCGVCWQQRFHRRMKAIGAIPRVRMPVTSKYTPRHIADGIRRETLRASNLECLPPEETLGQLGWGRPGTEFEKVHFKSSIAKSFPLLERAACHRDPTWARVPTMTLQEYVDFLLSVNPELDRRTAYRYLVYYIRARFSLEEFTFDEYGEFMKLFFLMVQAFESEDHRSGGMKAGDEEVPDEDCEGSGGDVKEPGASQPQSGDDGK